MSRGKWIALAVTMYLVAISIPTALASAEWYEAADVPLSAADIASEVDDRLREARVSEPAAMPMWEDVTALRLRLIPAAQLVLERNAAAAEAAAWEVIVRAFPGLLPEGQMVLQCPTCGERRLSARAVSDPRVFALANCGAHVSVPKPMVETDVLVLCALCGRSERAMCRVQEGPRRMVGYCSAKQCQWTSELEQKHPDWGRNVCVLIGLHKIRIGMTTQQVRESWGWPGHINTTITRWGRHEQWVYGRFPYSEYVYFEKGIVTTIQQ